ncbi:N-acetylmuramoyl-L-alanine amidase [Rhodobacteraceae bacterium M382]|nr:N-acetylmuramoyl-L-alanine amidase [Rhodobacteraceae bacterium M382]
MGFAGGFKDGVLQDVPFERARWIGGEITPEIVILHDTASRLALGNAAAYLKNNTRKVSVQFVIERDGSIVQQVPVNRRANHAGRSVYHGRKGCNNFAVGIELVNPGSMTRYSETHALAWYGERFNIAEYGIQEVSTPDHGHGLWMPYTEAQIDRLIALLAALFDGVPSLKDITTHWYVSPGRKVDTNPLFPLEHVRALIFGREDPVDQDVDAQSDPVETDEMVRIDVPGDKLNFRRWPSFNPNVLASIPDQAIVPVLRRGIYEGRQWLCVQYGGQEGWIVARYTAAITFDDHPASAAGFKQGDKTK